MSRRTTAAVLLAVCAALPARAEVSAELDALGKYSRMILFTNSSIRNARIWSVQKVRGNAVALNPDGDANGDLWPAVAEGGPTGLKKLPWAVWSRFNGVGYDLAFSQYVEDQKTWLPVAWVEPVPTVGDDLDPTIAFDSTGRPSVAWWRVEGGRGRIYVTSFLATRFMAGVLVSDPNVDSYRPTVTVLPDGRIQVTYDTPAGTVVRYVAIDMPATITDDITPFVYITIDPGPAVIQGM